MTLAAIGRRAGVSESTVSKVLNDRPDVAPATRRKVQAVLAAYGYNASNRAQANHVDVVMIDLHDPWAGQVLAELERAARNVGLGVVPSVSGTQSVSDDLLTRMLARGQRGVITIFADLNETQQRRLRSHRLPYVAVAGGRPAPRMVNVNYRAGVRAATDHLVATGHRRIALLLGPSDLTFTEQRLAGYQDGLLHAGQQFDPSLVRWGRFDQQSGADHAQAVLNMAYRPTAIIAGSDMMAIGVYRAAAEAGLVVGRDLAVVGFDDRPEAQWLVPQLSTIRMPLGQLADIAIDQLIHPAAGDASTTELSGRLIIRESSSRLWTHR